MQPEVYNRIIQTLQARYRLRGHLLTRGGVPYPLLTIPAGEGDSFDSLLAAPPHDELSRTEFAFYDESVLAHLRRDGRRLYNGVTFAFDHLETQPLRLHARLGRYFDHLATCIALENEIVNSENGGALPLRDQLDAHTNPADLIRHGGGRSAALGVGVLIAFASPGGYRLLVVQRSMHTAHQPGAFHVVPAFIFQPSMLDYPASEWDVTAQIKREYAEELFDAHEMENGGTDFHTHPANQQLDAMLADGRAELHFTGMALSLITTQVAIAALLLIHDPVWYDPRIGTTWESTGLFDLPLLDNDTALLGGLPGEMPHTRFSPLGAAIFWLGVDRARARLGLGTQGDHTGL